MKIPEYVSHDASVLRMLEPDTLQLANVVVQDIKAEDPVLLVQIDDRNSLHRALALPGAPAPQGIDATASLKAFRTWLIDCAKNVNEGSPVPSNSETSLAFHHLTLAECRAIVKTWNCKDWNYNVRENRYGPEEERIGNFVNVFWMIGTESFGASFVLFIWNDMTKV